jgi:hypothetical protein
MACRRISLPRTEAAARQVHLQSMSSTPCFLSTGAVSQAPPPRQAWSSQEARPAARRAARRGAPKRVHPPKHAASASRPAAGPLRSRRFATMSSPQQASPGLRLGCHDNDVELVRLTQLRQAAECRDGDGDAESAATCTDALQPAALRALVARAQTATDPVRACKGGHNLAAGPLTRALSAVRCVCRRCRAACARAPARSAARHAVRGAV